MNGAQKLSRQISLIYNANAHKFSSAISIKHEGRLTCHIHSGLQRWIQWYAFFSVSPFTVYQWSFRKIGTMETLANRAEIDVRVTAPGVLLRGPGGITPGNFRHCKCKILESSAFLDRKWFALPSIMHFNHFNIGNGIPTRSPAKWPLLITRAISSYRPQLAYVIFALLHDCRRSVSGSN